MKNVIKEIATSHKSKNILEELKNTYSISNLSLKNGKLESGYSIKIGEQNLPTEKILYSYKANGKFFVYTENKNLYECKDGNLVLVYSFIYRPSVISITQSGKEKVLVAGRANTAKLIDETNYKSVSFYNVDKMLLFGGRLFSSLDNKISFTKLYDFTNEEPSFVVDGTIFIADEYGSIEYICGINDNLYVFTERAVFSITCSGESIDFKFKRLENLELNVHKDTAIKVSDNVLFIENGKLFKFSNGKVSNIDTILDNGIYEIIGASSSGSGKYFLPVKFEERKGVFIYDTITQEQSVIECENPIVCNDGYLFDRSLNKVSQIIKSNGEYQLSREWKSLKTDFGTFKSKVINKIFVKSKSDCILTVFGDFGKMTFNVNGGSNDFSVNLPSKEYEFSLFSNSLDFNVENLTVNYRERGK